MGLFAAASVLLAACSAAEGPQSVLAPRGIQADLVYRFWWLSFGIAAIVFLLVIGTLAYATRRSPPTHEHPQDAERDRAKVGRVVIGAVAATIVILLGYFAVDLMLNRAQASLGRSAEGALTIEIQGHRWWWEVRYLDPVPQRVLTTANEIHIPVGRPVRVRMTSSDVIHSFWVPNLHGKKDLIPGHRTETWFRADEPGTYRGQCAEFCGMQHAKMGLLVIAETPAEFARWYESQLAPAAPPPTVSAARGQQVFVGGPCALCHTIRGTPASGRVAPDLTHLASRLTIGAATLPNTRGHLGGWVANPHGIKPGVKMPPNQVAGSELQDLLSYLESLR